MLSHRRRGGSGCCRSSRSTSTWLSCRPLATILIRTPPWPASQGAACSRSARVPRHRELPPDRESRPRQPRGHPAAVEHDVFRFAASQVLCGDVPQAFGLQQRLPGQGLIEQAKADPGDGPPPVTRVAGVEGNLPGILRIGRFAAGTAAARSPAHRRSSRAPPVLPAAAAPGSGSAERRHCRLPDAPSRRDTGSRRAGRGRPAAGSGERGGRGRHVEGPRGEVGGFGDAHLPRGLEGEIGLGIEALPGVAGRVDQPQQDQFLPRGVGAGSAADSEQDQEQEVEGSPAGRGNPRAARETCSPKAITRRTLSRYAEPVESPPFDFPPRVGDRALALAGSVERLLRGALRRLRQGRSLLERAEQSRAWSPALSLPRDGGEPGGGSPRLFRRGAVGLPVPAAAAARENPAPPRAPGALRRSLRAAEPATSAAPAPPARSAVGGQAPRARPAGSLPEQPRRRRGAGPGLAARPRIAPASGRGDRAASVLVEARPGAQRPSRRAAGL